jgi:hypothetical protein
VVLIRGGFSHDTRSIEGFGGRIRGHGLTTLRLSALGSRAPHSAVVPQVADIKQADGAKVVKHPWVGMSYQTFNDHKVEM